MNRKGYPSDVTDEEWIPNYQKVWDATENTADILRTDGTADVQKTLDTLDAEAQGYLDEYWASK